MWSCFAEKFFSPFNNESEKDTSMAGNWEPNNTLKVLCVLMCLYVPELKTRVFSTQNIVFVYISTYKKWEIHLRKKNKNNILSGTICHVSWLSISIIRFVFFSSWRELRICIYDVFQFLLIESKNKRPMHIPFFLFLVPFKLLNVILFSNKFYPHFNKFVKCQLNIRIRVVYYLFLCSEISRKKLTHYSNMRTKTPLQPLLNGNVIHTEWLPIGGTAFLGEGSIFDYVIRPCLLTLEMTRESFVVWRGSGFWSVALQSMDIGQYTS